MAWSDVGSFFTSVADSVVNAIDKFGPMVKDSIDKLGPYLSMVPGYIGTVARALTAVSAVLGIFNKDDDIEDIGDRAIQGAEDGITPDGFDSFDDYLQSLREMELDPEKTESTSQLNKVLAGAAVSVQGFSDKIDESPEVFRDLFVLLAQNPDFFTEERASQYVAHFDSVGDIVEFFNGKMNASEEVKILDEIMGVEKSMGGEKDEVGDQLQHVLRQTRGSN